MKKQVWITVDSRQNAADSGEDRITFETEGTFYQKGNYYYATYKESELTGMEGTTTMIKMDRESVTMMRFGTISSMIVLERGKKHVSEYQTAHGSMTVGVEAKSVEVTVDDSGGEINVNYTLDINYQYSAKTNIHIGIRESRPN